MFAYLQVDRPYPGLRPFEPWEASIFFGRDIHIDRLQDILKSQHFLTVTGPSGSGKSSLVRAGLLPALPLGAIGTGSDWRAVIMRPGDKPISSLAKALCDDYALGPELNQAEKSASTEINSTLPALEAELRRGPLGLVDLVKDLRQHAQDPDFNLLILVDQFEEIFTYAEAGTYQADESDAFVNLLLAASNNKEMRIFVIITMRTDFLGACTRFLGLPEMINRSLYLTPRLSREQLTQAIAGPAALFNLKLSADLVAEYVNAIQNEQDQLPVLQHALARRWDQLLEKKGLHADTTDYPEADVFQTVGNLGQALSDHADTVYNTLTDEQKLNAQWLFRAITEQRITEGGGQTVRRPQSLARIAEWSGRSWKEFLPIIKAFADPTVSFLTYKSKPDQPGEPEDDEKTVIDISHEAVMRQWASLKNWISSEGKAAQEYREWRQRAERKDSSSGSYLSGADLSQAEAWLKQGLDFVAPSTQSAQPNSAPHAEWANRYSQDRNSGYSFAAVKTFILQSRGASQFSKRLLNFLAIFMVIACLVAAGFGYYSYQQAIESAAKSLWFPLKSNLDLTKNSGADDLIIVAERDKNIRQRFIEEILYDENIASVFSSHYELLLRASTQSDLTLRNQLLDQLQIRSILNNPMSIAHMKALIGLEADMTFDQLLGGIGKSDDIYITEWLARSIAVKIGSFSDMQSTMVARYVEVIQQTTDRNKLHTLGNGLVAITKKLNDTQAAMVAAKYVEAVQQTTDRDQLRILNDGLVAITGKLSDMQAAMVVVKYVEVVRKTTDWNLLYILRDGLAAIVGKLDDTRATIVAAKYVEAVQQTTDRDQLRILGDSLAAIIGKLDDTQAAMVAAKYVEAVQQTTNWYQLSDWSDSLVAIAGKLDDTQAAMIIAKYVEAMQQTTDGYQRKFYGDGLAAIIGKLNDMQAAMVVAKYVEVVQEITDLGQLQAWSNGLAALAGKLDNARIAMVVTKYMEAMQQTTDEYRRKLFGDVLTAIARKLNDTQAAMVAAKYVEAMQRATDRNQLRAFSDSLAAIIGKLDDAQAAVVTVKYVEVVQEITDFDQFQALNNGLAVLAGKLDDAKIAMITAKYVEAMQRATDRNQLQALGNGLAAIIGKLDGAQTAVVTTKYVEAVQRATDWNQLQALGNGLAAIIGKLDDTQAAMVVVKYVEVVQKITDLDQLQVLSNGLAALAGKLNDAQAAVVTAKYVEAMQRATDRNQLQALGNGLAAIIGKLDDTQAAMVVVKYVGAVQQTTDWNQLRVLGISLSAFAGKLDNAQAAIIVAKYVEAMQTADGYMLQSLGENLAAMIGKFQSKNAESVAEVLLTELQTPRAGAKKAVLARSINTLFPHLTMNENRVRALLRISDIPFIDRDAIATAIRKQYAADAPGEDQGIWTFLQWANSYFGVNRPNKDELISVILKILLLPLLILIGGGLLLQLLSGRKLVALQLDKLVNKKDRQNLGMRFTGYTAEQVKSHWSVLGADERMIEQRFLTMDLIFAPIYGAAFLYALPKGAEYLDLPFPSAMLVALICTMILADWTENMIQLQQLKHMNQRGAVLQSGWIRIASLATQIKLLCGIIVMMLLLYICAQLLLF